MKAGLLRAGSVVCLCLLAVGCTDPSAESMSAAPSYGELRGQMDNHLDGCTRSFGVDPRDAGEVGPYELVANERAWLDCAYEGIRAIMIPNSQVPALYRSLIAESQALTNLVERGELTREQRWARIDGLVAEIEGAEINAMIAGDPTLSEERQRANADQIRETVDQVRMMAFPRGRR